MFTLKIFRQNHSPGSCDEDNEDFQTCQTFRWVAVSDLHTEPGLQRTRSPSPPHSRQLAHSKTRVLSEKNIKEKVRSTYNLDCVHDIFCGEGRVSVDISGQFLVFPDDPHHGGLRAPASVNVRQAGWRFVCSPWNIHPHSPTSHCSKQLLHDIQKQVGEEPS